MCINNEEVSVLSQYGCVRYRLDCTLCHLLLHFPHMVTTPAPNNLVNVESPQRFQELLSEDLQRVSLINFWATWAEPCQQMNQVVLELARRWPDILVLQVSLDRFSWLLYPDLGKRLKLIRCKTYQTHLESRRCRHSSS